MELVPGAAIDRYVVESRLGQGGMATVWKARHQQLGTWHAIKVLHGGDPRIRERLIQEGRIQARMRHPNIVSVTDVIDIDGHPGLVMEYVEGVSLDQFLERTRLTPEQVEDIAGGILDAVAAAHKLGVLHRDLKPANVMISPVDDGVVPKVMDFGLAKITEGESEVVHKTRSNMVMGSPCYMAPEQIRSAKSVDKRTDVFALGAILYEMLAGRRTFDQEELFDVWEAINAGRYPRLDQLVPGLPQRMYDAVHGALEVDRERRIPDVPSLVAVWTGVAPTVPATTSSPRWDLATLQSAATTGPIPLPKRALTSGETADLAGLPSAFEEGVTRSEPTFAALDEPAPPVTAPPPAPGASSPPTATSGRWLRVGVPLVGLAGLGGVGAAALAALGVGLWYWFLDEAAPPPPTPVNHPPTVQLAPSHAGEVGQRLTITAEIADPDGDPLDVVWGQPEPAQLVLEPGTVEGDRSTVALTPTAPGRYDLVLRLTDAAGAAVDGRTTLEVTEPAPASPVPPSDPRRAPPALPVPVGRGVLKVTANPAAGVSVTLDGSPAGIVGGWKRELGAGTHRVRLAGPGGTKDATIEVRPDEVTTWCWDFELGRACP